MLISYWLKKLRRKILLRSAFAFLVIHAGLILSIIGLCTAPREDMGASFYLLLAGVICLYLSLPMVAFFVIWPLYTLVQKVRYLLRWREWIWDELPRLIAYVPLIIDFLRTMKKPATESAPSPSAAATPSTEESRQSCDCPHCRVHASAASASQQKMESTVT